jgi:hypothetical protein
MDQENCLERHGLTLTTAPNDDRPGNQVWVERDGKYFASYAVATDCGVLASYEDNYEPALTQAQLDWLDSDEVQEFLKRVNY